MGRELPGESGRRILVAADCINNERVIIIKPCTPVVRVAVIPCNWAHAHVGEGEPLCFLFEEGDDLAVTA